MRATQWPTHFLFDAHGRGHRDGLGSAAYFGSYEFMKTHSTPAGEEVSVATTLIAGGFAGMLNWVVALPIDTLKSKLQVAPEKYPNGIRSVFSEVMRTVSGDPRKTVLSCILVKLASDTIFGSLLMCIVFIICVKILGPVFFFQRFFFWEGGGTTY